MIYAILAAAGFIGVAVAYVFSTVGDDPKSHEGFPW